MSASDSDHTTLRNRLQDAITSEKLGHALFLWGHAGSGRSHLATDIARRLLCDNPRTSRGQSEYREGPLGACTLCKACHLVTTGQHPDLHRLVRESGKRDITIDQVREIVDALGLRSHSGGGRAVIIEDADRMTSEAANALLKTLEEPPEGTTLLLIAPGTQSVLPTIASRCQAIRVPPKPPEAMAIAQRTLVEQAIRLSFSGDGDPIERATRLLDEAKPKDATLEEIREILRGMLVHLLRYVRDVEVTRSVGEGPLLVPEFSERSRQAATLWGPESASQAIDRLRTALRDLDSNITPALVLETLIWDLDEVTSP